MIFKKSRRPCAKKIIFRILHTKIYWSTNFQRFSFFGPVYIQTRPLNLSERKIEFKMCEQTNNLKFLIF